MPKWTREKIAKLSPSEFEKHEAEIGEQVKRGLVGSERGSKAAARGGRGSDRTKSGGRDKGSTKSKKKGKGRSRKKWTRQEIAKLTPAEFEKHRDEIADQMSRGEITQGTDSTRPTGDLGR